MAAGGNIPTLLVLLFVLSLYPMLSVSAGESRTCGFEIPAGYDKYSPHKAPTIVRFYLVMFQARLLENYQHCH